MKKILPLFLVLLVIPAAVYAVEESGAEEEGSKIIKVLKTGCEDEKECRIITIDEGTDLEDLSLEDGKVVKIITCDKADGDEKVCTKVITGDLSDEEIEHALQEALKDCGKMDLGDLEGLEDGKMIKVICLKADECAEKCTLEIDGEEITLDLNADIKQQLEGKIKGNVDVTEEEGLIKIVITQDAEE